MDIPYSDDTFVSRRTQTVAWIVVLFSFVLFLTICGLGTVGTYWFFFQSTEHLKTTLSVSRGVVGMRLGDVTTNVSAPNYEVDVPVNAILSVPNDSQGYLTFEDGTTHQLLGHIFLMGNTSLVLDDTMRPRFDWSHGDDTILLADITGKITLEIPPVPQHNRNLAFYADSVSGHALITSDGLYDLSATPDQLELATQYGQGILYQDRRQGALIKDDTVGSLSNGKITVKTQANPNQLIMGFGYDAPLPNNRMPTFWACQNNAPSHPNEPEGSWETKAVDGPNIVLRMFRIGPDLNHAETACFFTVAPDSGGQNITNYKTLSVRARVRISGQDVTTCGIQGTECPVMVALHYTSRNGEDHWWRQGFFAIRPDSDAWPLRCDTCPGLHQQLNKDEWFIFDSGDLFAQFPAPLQPASISELRVYASGHQFDVAIAEFALLGTTQ
jgi:hypothetical protein